MEKELVFHILEVKEVKDERAVKAAYMKKLRATNPEDDPEGFRKLREAYEQALLIKKRQRLICGLTELTRCTRIL